MSQDLKIKRLTKEGQRLSQQMAKVGGHEAHLQQERWSVIVPEDNLDVWQAYLLGPVDTPYEGQQYELLITFKGIDYPDKPPRVIFNKPIPFHANVYASNGQICIDILRPAAEDGAWSAVLKIGDILASLVSMLNNPNTASPANPEAGRAYDDDRSPKKTAFTRLAMERYTKQILK